MARFWNPGFAWKDTLKFDNPVNEPNSSNISYYVVDAPAKSFFEVKDTVTVDLGAGEFEQPLRFRELIRSQYAERGVVLVTMGRECNEEENIAGSDADAKSKGNRIWREYMKEKANEWFRIVHEVKANGAIPRAATGLFKRVLEELGMEDPADSAGMLTAAKEGQQSNLDMQKQIEELKATVNRLVGAQGAQQQLPVTK